MRFFDAQRRGGHRSRRKTFRVYARRVELGILLEQDIEHRFNAVVPHRLIVGRSLPFQLHDEEAVFAGHLQETGRFRLGARVIGVAVKQDHHRYAARRCAFQQFFRPVFVPQVFGPVQRPLPESCGIFHDDAPETQPLPFRIGFEFVRSVLAELGSFIVCMPEVVITEVA